MVDGIVASSSCASRSSASAALAPHMSGCGRRLVQTAGRSGRPNSIQRLLAVSWMQRTPAGLPFGIPGIDEEIDGAMQHAPQPIRQSTGRYCPCSSIFFRRLSGRISVQTSLI
jgi:hypothetical protein